MGVQAAGARKGPGSVASGIGHLHSLNLKFYKDEKTKIAFEEFARAKWAKDVQGNYRRDSSGRRVLDCKESKIAVHDDEVTIKDHALDAIRYAATYYTSPIIDEKE